MIKFTAQDLYRALDMAAMPARLTKEATGVFEHVQLSTTATGLIAESTDRYQLARTRAEYLDGVVPEQGFEPVLLHRDALKVLLPVLKAEKLGPVGLNANGERVTVQVYSTGQRLEFAAGTGEFPKLSALYRQHTTDEAPSARFGLNSKFVKALTMTAARHEDALVYSLAPRPTGNQALMWTAGDWAQGMIMPVRLADNPLGSASETVHAAFDEAAPLPTGAPESETVATAEPVQH